eukprot:TRINITY_DN54_c0_g1_i1.p1 TRINITY_DN54_c0_g1~~TRINITY_DN54_c0_g1_i1.p1  ORF type:complete len:193 (-),score=30.66 TRINITY_DN54_c0_g1_i1:207-785(-)
MSKVPDFDFFKFDNDSKGDSIVVNDDGKSYVKSISGHGRKSSIIGDKYFHEGNDVLTWRLDFHRKEGSAFQYGVIIDSFVPLKNSTSLYKEGTYSFATNGGFTVNNKCWGFCDNKSSMESYVIVKLDCNEKILYAYNANLQIHFIIENIQFPCYPFFHSWCPISVKLDTISIDYPEITDSNFVIVGSNNSQR